MKFLQTYSGKLSADSRQEKYISIELETGKISFSILAVQFRQLFLIHNSLEKYHFNQKNPSPKEKITSSKKGPAKCPFYNTSKSSKITGF
jgi:hypothetical protein